MTKWLVPLLCLSAGVFAVPSKRAQVPLLIRDLPTETPISPKPRTPAAPRTTTAPSRTKVVPNRAPAFAAAPAPQSTTAVRLTRRGTLVDVTVGPGMAMYRGLYQKQTDSGFIGYTVNVGAATPLRPGSHVYVGADLGLNFWNFNPTRREANLSALGIQLLPTIYYRFPLFVDPALYPYVGLSVGPHLFNARTTDLATNETQTDLSVYFEALVRVGFAMEIARNFAFDFEPKFGILRSEFIFLPQINAHLFL